METNHLDKTVVARLIDVIINETQLMDALLHALMMLFHSLPN